MTKHLVCQSLLRAVAAKRPAAGLLHHSDRGSQYCARTFRDLLGFGGFGTRLAAKTCLINEGGRVVFGAT